MPLVSDADSFLVVALATTSGSFEATVGANVLTSGASGMSPLVIGFVIFFMLAVEVGAGVVGAAATVSLGASLDRQQCRDSLVRIWLKIAYWRDS